MWTLHCRSGRCAGKRFPLEAGKGPCTVGRDPDSQIRLEEEGVSKRHAEFLWSEGKKQWIVSDLDSSNGTYVNGLRIREHPLSPRDVIHIGPVELFVVEASDVRLGGEDPAVGKHGTRLEPASPSQMILGDSQTIRKVIGIVERMAPLDSTVLIQGETGTGKELVARALHSCGRRSHGAFVDLNCGAIPEDLAESELFGHEKGAFTGAAERGTGCFEAAGGGTLFLDEVGDLPGPCQAKLLRALETKTIRRVGGTGRVHVNVRLIAATNKDLRQCVKDRVFRADLYHRLSVVEIHLPPLRERLEDVLPLADHFLALFSLERGGKPFRLTSQAQDRLLAHAWPGNVRELKNVMEKAAAAATEEGTITPAELQIGAPERDGPEQPFLLERMEREKTAEALRAAGGNKKEAARLLGISRMTLYRRLKQYRLDPSGE